jgi:hypothetical protein
MEILGWSSFCNYYNERESIDSWYVRHGDWKWTTDLTCSHSLFVSGGLAIDIGHLLVPLRYHLSILFKWVSWDFTV